MSNGSANSRTSSIARVAILLVSFGLLFAMPQAASAALESAEVVLLIGSSERKDAMANEWAPLAVKQQVKGGSFVRTLANSQVGLLMPDRTQIRLNQNSQLQIKSGAESTQWTENAVRLNAGRAWSQARPQTAQSAIASKPVRLVMETPSATLSIRGTDWEVEVGPDGQTHLTVLTGVVGMDNAFGSVQVAPGETAMATRGRAPVKLQLSNPASRVQWVTSWAAAPKRWLAGDPKLSEPVTTALVSADAQVARGEFEGAIAVLTPLAATDQSDPRVVALLVRVLLRADRSAEAGALLAPAASGAGHVELALARGEFALFQGNASAARDAFQAALAMDSKNAEAWYGLGLIQSELENVLQARTLLTGAVQLDPLLGKAQAELAAVETFAGNLRQSDELVKKALEIDPVNYLAFTARGINHLKRGLPNEALEDFLRAGLIEPRYARAWLFSGVAFYQLGERVRAVQSFERAAKLDTKDPIPHLLQSVVEADDMSWGASVLSAQAAQLRMPYLKSLNQVANNQKGSANLGSALANFGLEEWAMLYADAASTPYWAGSHLFLADRYNGKYSKNSELMQGFLTEPTVFGASNRQSTLVAVPGHFGRIEGVLEQNDWQQVAANVAFNGMVTVPVPAAYFVSGDIAKADSKPDGSAAQGGNVTLGLGLRPSYDLGLFGFGTNVQLKSTVRSAELPDNPLDQKEGRFDGGLNYKLASDNQIWIKAGSGSQSNLVVGPYVSQSTADSLNSVFQSSVFVAQGQLDQFSSALHQEDFQFRHSFNTDTTQWTWGAEQSAQNRRDVVVTTFPPARIAVAEERDIKATDIYLSARQKYGSIQTQLGLLAQQHKVRSISVSTLEVLGTSSRFIVEDENLATTYEEWNLQAGIHWKPSEVQSLRVVTQQWRRPASAGQLAPVDTLGIAVNDQLAGAGGRYQRVRAQWDRQFGSDWMVRLFGDSELIDNGLAGKRTAITGFEVTQLASLRNRPDVFAPPIDLEGVPAFAQGRITSLGIASNIFLTSRHSLALRALHRDAIQSGSNEGLAIPFIPKDFFQVGGQWLLQSRISLGANATYRSGRYRDDVNLDPLRGGWALGFSAYWESADKTSAVQAILDNLLSDSKAGLLPEPHWLLRYSRRF